MKYLFGTDPATQGVITAEFVAGRQFVGPSASLYNFLSGWAEFNVNQLLRMTVNSLTLRRTRQSINSPASFPNQLWLAPVYPLASGLSSMLPARITQTDPTPTDQRFLGSEPHTSGTIDDNISSWWIPGRLSSPIFGVTLWESTTINPDVTTRESAVTLIADASPLPAPAPTITAPLTAQNPKGPIVFNWTFNSNSQWKLPDPQDWSQIDIWQVAGTVNTVTIANTNNTYTLPANYYSAYVMTYFRVRVRTQYNVWGDWSTQRSFMMRTTPPQAPTPIFPVGVSVNAESGTILEFQYNSLYDTEPSQFEVYYRIDGGGWTTITQTYAGQLNVMTGNIVGQHTVEWRVRAWGYYGDVGPYSPIVSFFSIGKPVTPTIIDVTTTPRPIVTFSTTGDVSSWDMEFWVGSPLPGDPSILPVTYAVYNQPFTGFSYQVNTLFEPGVLYVRMRVANRYGYVSNWTGVFSYVVNGALTPYTIMTTNDMRNYIRIYMDNANTLRYVYRSVYGENNFLRIAKIDSVAYTNLYDDYTVAPGVRYIYFIRRVNNLWSWVDSNHETGFTIFRETVISKVSDPQDMLKLFWQIDGRPTKDRNYSHEKSFSNFLGRSSPVLQIGDFITRTFSFSFYLTKAERDKLEELSAAQEPLMIRDTRYGTVYGVIDGDISDRAESIGKYVTSFTVREVDYPVEVEL